ncbi:MAG: SH3 domain-containing protein [Rhizobiaceae bacterium]
MSLVDDKTAETPPEPVIVQPAMSQEQKAARQRHRLGLAAAGGSIIIAASAFAAIVVQAHVAEAERADPFSPKPVIVRKVAVAAESAPEAERTIDVAETDGFETPNINDPRWARATTALTEPVRVKPSVHGASAFSALETIRQGFEPSDPDELETAAIDPADKRHAVKPEPQPDVATSTRPAQRLATVMADVRLRAGPNDRSAVLGVVKSGTDVGVVSCDGWCEVIAGDKRGFVYKRFVGQAKATVNRQKIVTRPARSMAPANGRGTDPLTSPFDAGR